MRALVLFALAVSCFGQAGKQQALLVSYPPPATGIQFLSTATGECSSASTCATGSFSVTSGHLVACEVNYKATESLSSVTDSQSNTYSLLSSAANINGTQFAYAKNVTGSGSLVVTAHYSASTNFSSLACVEISNVSTTSPLDVDDNALQNNGLDLGSGQTLFSDVPIATSTAAEAVMVGCGFDRAITSAATFDLSYNSVVQSATGFSGIWGKVTTSTLSGDTPTKSTASPNNFWACTAASFK